MNTAVPTPGAATEKDVIAGDDFFCAQVSEHTEALALAARLIEDCSHFAEGVRLLVSDSPLATPVTEVTGERLVASISPEKMLLASGVVEFIRRLGSEVRGGDYFLTTMVTEISALSPFTHLGKQLEVLQSLRDRGCRPVDLPADQDSAYTALLELSKELNISLEYLLGNLDKAILLFETLGVRDTTLNLSGLFHNYQSGFLDTVLDGSRSVVAAEILGRAKQLEANGFTACIFDQGKFNKKLSDIDIDALDRVSEETEQRYDVAPEEFLRFIDVCLSKQERKLEQAPALALRELLACFKFTELEREVVARPAVVKQDDPLRWRETELGRALVCLRHNLNWLAVSIGIKAAGDLAAYSRDDEILSRIEELQELAGGYQITIPSGRSGAVAEPRFSELSEDDLVFDLYCLAVLEKKGFSEVLDAAISTLQVIRTLENREPIVDLSALIRARLAGESYVTLLGTQGLILRNAPIVMALEDLRALSDKVKLTVQCADNSVKPVADISVEEFRRAIILMGRHTRMPHSPERILAVISDRVVPEIRALPAKVIAPTGHDLNRIVDLAVDGVPPRYPLRRPWTKLNLDPMITHGSCLQPGIRNCLGCPVNSLYGLVMKSALACGYGEVITYEATGCFEVYSGIWPYTGKTQPSVHGVFGGVASEMLGGLAAKRARARYAGKPQRVNGDAAKILHLGWAGDGATFDIGFGNVSGLFSRLQKLSKDELDDQLHQRALYVCYDNEGYQNTGNQYSAATSPGGNTTTNPQGKNQPIGNDMRKKPIVEIVAEHGVPLAARMNIHRQEHLTRVVARALEDGDRGSFVHFLQPCTTGWKFAADSLTYDLSYLSEEGGLFTPVTIEEGVAYLEIYPTARDPGDSFLELQARFRHLLGAGSSAKEHVERVMDYHRQEWERTLRLTGYDGEIAQADRFGYLEEEHRMPRVC